MFDESQRSKGAARFDVVIIGSSLSGLTLALACANRGIRTSVLERGHEHQQGGAALGVDRALLLRVVGKDKMDENHVAPFPVLTGYRQAVSWQTLHGWLHNLARQRPEITLMNGYSVSEVVQNHACATAITTNGARIDAQVIVGADGYRSMVREAVVPERPHASYAGYLLWRGLVPEAEMPLDTAWPQGDDGKAFVTETGYRLIAYPVPDQHGSLQPGERLISFAWYDATRDTLLQKLGCLTDSGHVLGSLRPAFVPTRTRDELCDLARRIWPEPWRGFIVHALERRAVFATPVSEYFPRRLHCGRVAIIGDAAHVVSPVTGKGFAAGILDAEALADCLDRTFHQGKNDPPSALRCYEERRLVAAQTLAATSIEWSRAYLQGVQRVAP